MTKYELLNLLNDAEGQQKIKSITKELNDTPKIKRVRNFWEIYAANDYLPIGFYEQGNVQKIIDNDLVIPMGKLQQLRKCES